MFRSLDLFIVVAEEKNLIRASERLHLSQSALTRRIQAQEEDLGVRLFDRTGRGVELTPAGSAWLQHARHLRDSINQATDQVRRISQGQVGRLDIGVFGSTMFNVVPDILDGFCRANPAVEMVLHHVPRTEQLEALRQGRSMACFMPFYMGETDVQFDLVCREKLVVALNEAHPLAGREVLEFDDLDGQAMIGIPSSHDVAPQFHELLKRIRPRISQRSDNVVTALAMVRYNFGISVVPASLQALQVPRVVYRPLRAEEAMCWDLYCVYRKNERAPVLHALLDAVQAYRERSAQVAAGL